MIFRSNPKATLSCLALGLLCQCTNESSAPGGEPTQPSSSEPTTSSDPTGNPEPTNTGTTEPNGSAGSTPTSPPGLPTATNTGGAGGTTNAGGAPNAGGTAGDANVPSAGGGGLPPAAGGSGGAPATTEFVRELLSQTGLYSDLATETLGERVLLYEPQFELWTDGAGKRRWIHIPEGTQIDTSNIDEWKFPVGTKLWKEFSRDGIRIETRLLEKLPPEHASLGFEGWLMVAYVWDDDQTEAVATPMGLENAKGTAHDVPDQEACGKCHDMRVEKPLGFSAVQLAHEGEGATLSSLLDAGWLSTPPAVSLDVPGDDAQRELLGALHANCGHCHRARAPVNSRVSSLRLWLESASLSSVEETDAYRALVNQYTESAHGSVHEYRVVGGDPENSELYRRISVRGEVPDVVDPEIEVQMPPLGTEIADERLLNSIRAWIESLPPPPPAP